MFLHFCIIFDTIDNDIWEAALNMKYNLPDRIVRELCSFAKKIPLKKSFCLVPAHEERIQNEAISISLYTAGILMTFIGMLRKKRILS